MVKGFVHRENKITPQFGSGFLAGLVGCTGKLFG